ncbi:DUF937 domain-containing protein [Hymenobacter ruricola]|uniref:DUF937 domain-containing protein n=1 Tax=Hymenobacter ruricola TaxID=2791023 RepID=A0ABS0I1L8_9BACT|nr:DUF937 domain-containing protein [Hymenobacter ruricola]MBF9220841.1 DUF937 domain-containing protein [Hymenobacter ruricola]
MNTLPDTLKTTFSPELVGHLAARLGESEQRTQKALDAAIPVLLGGLVAKAATGSAQELLGLSQQALRLAPAGASTVTGVLGILGSGAAVGGAMWQAEALLVELLGATKTVAQEAVGEFSGVKAATAAALLPLVGAVLPAMLAAHAAAHHLCAQELAAALASWHGQVQKTLPTGQLALLTKLVPEQKPRKAQRNSVPEPARRSGAAMEWPLRVSQGLAALAGMAGGFAGILRLAGGHVSLSKWAIGMLPAVDLSFPLATLEVAKLWNFAW